VKINQLPDRLQKGLASRRSRQRIGKIAREVAHHAPDSGPIRQDAQAAKPTVVFFNASTRITGLSQNAAFSLLASWGLRLAGVNVVHFVCEQGMSRCVLGLNRSDFSQPPPCPACMAQSRRLYAGAEVRPFIFQADQQISARLEGLSVAELSIFEHPAPFQTAELLPLGRLTLPSVRWTLRRHHLPDDEPTRFLMRAYIESAYFIAGAFAGLLQEVRPAAAVIFNGIMYPEAVARWVAQQMGIPHIAHEVGFQAFSTFFTDGEPTAYPIHIPEDFQLTPAQEARLDTYLEKRFQGKFTMAGIRFWPDMQKLDQAFLERAAQFRQIVPVFTNVIYDSSQVHANRVFPHMFAWLDLILEIIRDHPETFFVIRAHPDEMRPGTAKQSNESVRDWVSINQADSLPNVLFIDSQEYVSSYELIQRSRFVMVYNSSIGMEATLMGVPVLCGGQARYTQYPMVFFPQTAQGYREQAEAFLTAEKIELPGEFRQNARRFLYYQLYRTSLPMERYLQASPRMGFVELKQFEWQSLSPENSPTVKVLRDGILEGKPFLMPEDLS
jgi:hypothetical protein